MRQYQHKNVSLLDVVWHYKFHLFFYILGISILSFATLYTLGLIPEELRFIDQGPQPTATVAASGTSNGSKAVIPKVTNSASTHAPQGELPQRVIISSVGIDTYVTNPTSTNNDVLNNYLLKGAIRYPGSGTLGKGNLFIMGHSSHLKLVNNQAYKALNNLEDVKMNDIIRVQSGTKEYTYKVSSVEMVESDEALVDLSTSKNMITITTCNVLGEKQQRFMVKGIFVSSKNI